MNAVEVDKLTFNYTGKPVLKNLSFSLKEGRVLGLLGPNGVGKSTLINILNGFLVPHSGTAKLFGEPCLNLKPDIKQRVGYLMEGHIQYNFMNVLQAERFYSLCYPRWNSDLYHENLSNSNIAYNQKIGNMSCGQRSGVALSILMAQNADLLILDDFSMGLDPIYRRKFITTLKDFVKTTGKTVLATSHIVQDMEELIDDVFLMGLQDNGGPQTLQGFIETNNQNGETLEDIFINLYKQ